MISERQYHAIETRVQELLKIVDNNTTSNDKDYIELEVLSMLLADYEDKNNPIVVPDLKEILRLRMIDFNLTQEQLAEKIGITASRLSQYLNGKAEPTYKVAKDICQELQVHPAIVLGLKDPLIYLR